MSFAGYKEIIEAGDTVVIFLGHNLMYAIKVEKGNVFQMKYGALKHNDLLGKSFGSKITCSKGWVYVLHPTPELWTVTLPHRTQILYSTDISMVILQLDLKPGSIVYEAGTGSGSLSHAIARTIGPSGHLHTFDFHSQRVDVARQEFEEHGLSSVVTVGHRDVCENGFDLENIADAVFLDLPTPWDVIPASKKVIKLQGGRLCSFSPCIEQVQRTHEALTLHDFLDITTVECLLRTFDVRTMNMPIPDLGVKEDNKDCILISSEISQTSKENMSTNNDMLNLPPASTNITTTSINLNQNKISSKNEFSFKSGVPPSEMPGHTGYLTFATLYPKIGLEKTEDENYSEESKS